MGKANKIAAATEKRRRHFCHFSLVPPSLRNCGNRSQNASGRHSREGKKKIKPPARPPIHSADLYGCSTARSRKKAYCQERAAGYLAQKTCSSWGKGECNFSTNVSLSRVGLLRVLAAFVKRKEGASGASRISRRRGVLSGQGTDP